MRQILLITSALIFAVLSVLIAIPHRDLAWDELEKNARIFSGAVSREDQKPLEGTVIVVTGATSGIGLGLTRTLTKFGASVVALGRSRTKLDSLVQELPTITPVLADLADLKAVSNAATEILEKFSRIDALINNAGIHEGFTNVMGGSKTVDGYDLVFGVNYLSHFLLTKKLSPLLSNTTNSRLIQVSSSYHYTSDGSDLTSVDGQPPPASLVDGLPPFLRIQRSYSASKLAQIYHARALKRHDPLFESVRVASVCPGWVASNVAQSSGPIFDSLVKLFGYPIEGWGISSVLQALLGSDAKADFYLNSRTFEFFKVFFDILPTWSYRVGLRDALSLMGAMLCMVFQKFGTDTFPALSSRESYDEAIGDSLFDWSNREVEKFL